MTQKRDMTAPKMTRVTVRVPKTTLNQIDDWVEALGVRRSHFLGIALVSGVRSLMRASALKVPLSPESDLPAGEPVEPAAEPGTPGLDELTQTVKALKSEIVGLQSEVTDLRERLQSQ
jgi:hypothetical protein